MSTLDKATLDQVSQCDCGHCIAEHEKFYLHSRCHPGAPIWTFYRRGTGLLTAECSVCRGAIAEIVVGQSDFTVPGPIRLNWTWHQEYLEWVAEVPARDHLLLDGKYVFHAVQRPSSCDRGQWLLLIEEVNVEGLDYAEGFPRYYFCLEHLQREMEIWANKRQACLNALKHASQAKPGA